MNPILSTGYRLLEVPACYDFFQSVVGSTKYVHEVLRETFLDEGIRQVVDLGCGTGSKTPFLRENMKYLGVDISAEYVNTARNRDSRAETTYVVSDLAIPGWIKQDDFQSPATVLAVGIFHHLDDTQLNSLLKILQETVPNGSKLVSIDPTVLSSTSKSAAFMARQDRGKFLRTPERLSTILANHGFLCTAKHQQGKLRIPFDTLVINGTKI